MPSWRSDKCRRNANDQILVKLSCQVNFDSRSNCQVSQHLTICNIVLSSIQYTYVFWYWCSGCGIQSKILEKISLQQSARFLEYICGIPANQENLWNGQWQHADVCIAAILCDTWECYCVDQQKWMHIRCRFSPSALEGHSACVVGNSMFVYGGCVDGVPQNSLWQFDFGPSIFMNQAFIYLYAITVFYCFNNGCLA